MISVDNRVVVLTGATGVVGTALAKRFASQNATLILGVRNVEKGEILKKSLSAQNPSAKISVHEVDVQSWSSLQRFVSSISAEHPAVDVLVNNAGAIIPQRTLTPEGIEATLMVNVVSYVYLMAALLPLMQRPVAADGTALPAHVINMSTIVADDYALHDLSFADRAYHGLRAFKQSSGAIRALTALLQPRYLAQGVVVTAVHPGTITSPLLEAAGFTRGLDSEADIADNVEVVLRQSTVHVRGAGEDTPASYYRDGAAMRCEFSFEADKATDLLARVEAWISEGTKPAGKRDKGGKKTVGAPEAVQA
jgi:NAD(P)-dependent dehydrogenase (short-subunit alcohol dehydrogenase family)